MTPLLKSKKLTFEFSNNPEDGKPEIILNAENATNAEKILLFGIMKRYFGRPVILREQCVHENGMATQVKIAFGKQPTPDPDPENPEEENENQEENP